jgi:hypothetical protein
LCIVRSSIFLRLFSRRLPPTASNFLRLFSLLVCAVTFFLVPKLLFAISTATLTGRVTDSIGGVLADVEILATNLDINAAFPGKTNKLGLYRLPLLPPGNYRIIIRKYGFRTIVKPGIRLHLQDIIALNFSMRPGSATSSITEEGGIPLLQAETSMQSMTVGQNTLNELPSLTRNPYDFVTLSSGAIPINADRLAGFALNGQRTESGSFLLDGSDNNDPYNSGPGQIVPLEAVQEYRLVTHNFPAEFGGNSGFVANVLTKSGINEWHGSFFYFLRNSRLAANTYENNARGIPKPVFSRQQFGGSLGGPIISDRVFFFAALEPILVRSTATLSYYVPTPQLLAVSSSGTNAIFKKFPLPSSLNQGDFSIRTVCPYGSIVCGGKLGTGFVTLPAFVSAYRNGPVDAGAGSPQDTYLSTLKFDYSPNARTNWNVRYAFQNMNLMATVSQPYTAQLDQASSIRNQNVTVNLTHFWSGNFFTESRLVYNRLSQNNPQTPYNGFPSFAISGDIISGASRSLSIPSGQNGYEGVQNIYQFYQSASWIRGRHNLKGGFNWIHRRDFRVPAEISITRSNFGEFYDLQGFVNGLLANYQLAFDPKGHFPGESVNPPFESSSSYRQFRNTDLGFFLQDTWKSTPRLSISYGIRHEYFGQSHRPGAEKSQDASFYYGNASNVYERIASGELLRTVDAPANYRNHFYRPSLANFAPRFGVAYDATGNGRTVLRGALGVFYEHLPGFTAENLNPPSQGIIRLTNVPLTADLLNNPYSVFPNEPIGFPPSSITHFDQDLKTAYSFHFHSSLEHQLSRSFIVSAAYIGSKGSRLYHYVNENRIGSGIYLDRCASQPCQERLFPQASSMVALNNQGFSNYHAFQFRFESANLQNLGIQFGTNYTWSHSIDNSSSLLTADSTGGNVLFPLDAFDPSLDKGSSDFDLRHRWIGHFIWRIPYPRSSNGWKHTLLHGWEISTILSAQSGLPFTIFDNRVPDREISDDTRPIVTGPLSILTNSPSMTPDKQAPNAFLYLPVNLIRYPNGSCIPNSYPLACLPSVNGPYQGALGRNVFSRPGLFWSNLSFMKNIDFSGIHGREGISLQLRAEFYNFTNHSNLYIKPDTTNIAAAFFNSTMGTVPGVVTSYGTPEHGPQEARQVVFGIKLLF